MKPRSLFIHSTGTGPAMWDSVPAMILGATEKLAPANLGYPPGPPLHRGARGGAAMDAQNLHAALGDEGDVHLYAHSYGASVALDLVQRLGARARSIFLYEPVFFGALARDDGGDTEAGAEARAFGEHPWFLRDDAIGGTDPWLEHFIDYWNRPGAWSRMPEPLKDASRAFGWKMYQEVRSCFFDVHSFDERPIPQIPATLVTGERSTKGARAMARALARRNPHATFVELAGAGHMALVTKPETVHPVLLAHAHRAGVV